MTGEALPAEHNDVLASSDSFASVKGAESSFTPRNRGSGMKRVSFDAVKGSNEAWRNSDRKESKISIRY